MFSYSHVRLLKLKQKSSFFPCIAVFLFTLIIPIYLYTRSSKPSDRLIRSLKISDAIVRPIRAVEKISMDFKSASKLFRPALKDPLVPLNFDEYSDDRILLQREWIRNMSNSNVFHQLKPKKILVEFGALPDPYYIDGKLHCKDDTRIWESKCKLFLDPPELHWFDSKAQANRNFDGYDAVIETIHWWQKRHVKNISKSSSLKQIIVTIETSFYNGPIDFSLNNAMLVSYWRGSDISIPYSKWIPRKSTLPNSNSNSQDLAPTNYAHGKTRLASILVSNCGSNNARLEYVRELQRYMDVDIYGKCGNFSYTENYFTELKKNYKFYLAFENANCRDYITEKVFENAILNDVVPVVLGAEKRDYVYALPSKSFIHVEDFDSPRELARYLKKVDENDKMYNKFFEWKSKGSFTQPTVDMYCRICALLHLSDFAQPPVWPKGSTWDKVNVCLPQGRWYWYRPNSDLNSSRNFM